MQNRQAYEAPQLTEVGTFFASTQGLGDIFPDFFGLSDDGIAVII